MKRFFAVFTVLLALLILLVLPRAALGYLPATSAPPQAGGGAVVVGDGTPASCTEAAFATALETGDSLTFNCGVEPYTLTLTHFYTIGNEVEIDGGALITLQQVAGEYNRHFKVTNVGSLRLNNLTVQGNAPLGGGGVDIASFGLLVTENVTFTQNNNISEYFGGAVANAGTVLLHNSRFLHNSAVLGGGLYNAGKARLVNVDFHDNFTDNPFGGSGQSPYGGGLANVADMYYVGGEVVGNTAVHTESATIAGGLYNSANLEIAEVRFAQNDATYGSAIYTFNGDVIGHRLTIVDNGAADHTLSTVEIYTSEEDTQQYMQLTDSDISGNVGAGVLTTRLNILALGSSTIANNTGHAMSLQNAERVSVNNSTLSHNIGGVLATHADVAFTHSTLVGNGSYNVELTDISTATFDSSVLVDGTTANCVAGNTDTLVSWGYNLASDDSCGLITVSDFPNNALAGLGPLQDNGGPTLTHLPAPDSALIDHSDCDSIFPVDQRGVPRPAGASCDIGSVEWTAEPALGIQAHLPLVQR